MKKYVNLTLAAAMTMAVCFTACKKEDKEPEPPKLSASFTMAGDLRPAPTTVVFTNNSQNAVSYEWDFGNGETSTDKNPQVRYTQKGAYDVKLKVTDADGKTKETLSTAIVYGNITKVQVDYVKIPKEAIKFTDGTLWNFPNLYFKIMSSSGSEVFNLGEYYLAIDLNEAQYTNGVGFGSDFTNMPFTLPSLTATYTIRVLDYISGSQSDLICSDTFKASSFIPTDTLKPYPASFQTADKKISFNVKWKE